MVNNNENKNETPENSNFLYRIIQKDLDEGVYNTVHTRFPPEPNGYLHIGSAYAINISYSATEHFKGKFNLRFDDTNPAREEIEYVNSIIEDIKWLGCEWEGKPEPMYASDYFPQCYEFAVDLIKKGKAYVCDLSKEEIREYRGTLTETGKNSPFRDRSIEENLQLFEEMKDGKHSEGSKVLRAKINMKSPNMNMRDPIIYRISYTPHYRTKDTWCIYPMYDYAHPIQDAIEGITHSMCSAEFKDHRPLYEWVLNELDAFEKPPKQREFGRMGLTGTVMSKRYLRTLVEEKYVDGWDDPRMPTLSGLRRRGYTPSVLSNFLNNVGISKAGSIVDMDMLEAYAREELQAEAPSIMAVLKPLKVTITNYPEGEVEWLEDANHPKNEDMGTREIPFTREIYIERDDFMEDPIPKYKRLSPGVEVRLRKAYFIKCNEVIKDENGNVVELKCTYDPATKSGSGFKDRKPKGTIHWVSATESIKAEVRLYDRLIMDEEPEINDWTDKINPNSLDVIENAYIEPVVKKASKGDRYQFIRNGFFVIDTELTTDEKLVFNRVVSLKKSNWKKK